MKIKSLDPSSADRYTYFLSQYGSSLLYYSLKYRDMLLEFLDCESEYLIAELNGKIKGILPLMIKDGEYGRIVNSLPFYGSNGGILADDEDTYHLLLAEYNHIANSESTAASTLITNPFDEYVYTGITHDLTDTRIGQWTSLPDGESPGDVLMDRFHYKTRNMIRKAIKSGVTIQEDNGRMNFIRDVHHKNMAAIGGKAKPERFFALVEKYFSAGTDYDIFTASMEGQIIAGLLVFYFNRTVEYYAPVVKEVFRSFQPLSLIIFEAMKKAACKGFAWWNWGGTWATQEGVYRFKKRWGSVDKVYTYYTKINNPDIYKKSKENLLQHYDHFYVIDFKKLIGT
jgi:lipid II:glycine glycyltransferase (peptidoglycan interpeptide bridge formation enzyme)